MAVIDPEGLFNGDRLRKCSDMARLYWPYLFLAANGFGRFELNYSRITRSVFVDFRTPPTEEEFYGLIKEYRDAHLLFIYEAKGQIWGQWDCKKNYLPRWKTSRDRQSPEPPKEQYEKWVASYHNVSKPLPKIFESLQKFSETLESLQHGKGLCRGSERGCEGEANKDSLLPVEVSIAVKSPPNGGGKASWKKAKFEEFWSVVWAKKARGNAQPVFEKHAKTPEIADQIIAAAKKQGPGIIRNAAKNGHTPVFPATWLNGQRWLDEDLPLIVDSGDMPDTDVYDKGWREERGV